MVLKLNYYLGLPRFFPTLWDREDQSPQIWNKSLKYEADSTMNCNIVLLSQF